MQHGVLEQQTQHRPLRFLGQLIDDPYHPTHRARSRHREVLAPDFDVRETELAYYLEGEFPGIADNEAIKLEWVDNRTLAIDAKVVKVDLDAEWGLPLTGMQVKPVPQGEDTVITDAPNDARESVEATQDGGPLAREQELERRKMEEQTQGEAQRKAQQQMTPPAVRDWLAERRVGHYQRTFTFPADVDAVAVRARLGQGLLRILVPKIRDANVKAKQIPIENVE